MKGNTRNPCNRNSSSHHRNSSTSKVEAPPKINRCQKYPLYSGRPWTTSNTKISWCSLVCWPRFQVCRSIPKKDRFYTIYGRFCMAKKTSTFILRISGWWFRSFWDLSILREFWMCPQGTRPMKMARVLLSCNQTRWRSASTTISSNSVSDIWKSREYKAILKSSIWTASSIRESNLSRKRTRKLRRSTTKIVSNRRSTSNLRNLPMRGKRKFRSNSESMLRTTSTEPNFCVSKGTSRHRKRDRKLSSIKSKSLNRNAPLLPPPTKEINTRRH